MRIITGSTGHKHITASDDGEFNQGIWGSGSVVLANGNKLAATLIDNNTVRIADGDLVLQGRHALVDPETYEEVTIQTGTADVNRHDLIVARYQLDSLTGYESITLEVITGEEYSGQAYDPNYNEGSIRTGSHLVDFPLYRVVVEGISVTSVVPLFEAKMSLMDMIGNIEVIDSMTEIKKNEDEGKIAGALAVKELSGDVEQLSESLSNFDISETSLPEGTSLGEVVTMLAKKMFPKLTSLFMNGTVNTEVTGGFNSVAAKLTGGHSAKAPTLSITSNAMTISQTNGTVGGTVSTKSLVDLTDYTKLVIKSTGGWNVSNTDQSTLVITSSLSTNYDAVISTPITSQEIVVDITGLSGAYYIGVCVLTMNTARTINISELYLE